MEKIRFKDLSAWLKVAVIVMWITGIYYALAFLVGVLLTLIEGV